MKKLVVIVRESRNVRESKIVPTKNLSDLESKELVISNV